MVASSRHSGVRWDEDNSRLAVFVRGTSVAFFDDATNDLTLQVNGIAGLGTDVSVTMADDERLALGTGDDVVMVQRSTELLTTVELADVIVGTSVVGTIPANSLIISDITADGDLVFSAQTGGHSHEYFRADASTLNLLVNDASSDHDFRVESDGNTHAIFVEGSTNRVGIFNSSPGVALDITGGMSSSGIISTDEWQTTGGGTVTQATSKDTGFTLDQSTGVVTLSNSSVAAAGHATATFTNSTIAATSTVVLTHAASGAGNPESYRLMAGAMADGSCSVTVRNLTGGALGEAIQFNFVVIGGASS